jgi:hypothetical protein
MFERMFAIHYYFPSICNHTTLIVHVLHNKKSTMYDTLNSTLEVFNTMEAQYAGPTWHYIDPMTNQQPDLHHVIIYRGIGGDELTLSFCC